MKLIFIIQDFLTSMKQSTSRDTKNIDSLLGAVEVNSNVKTSNKIFQS